MKKTHIMAFLLAVFAPMTQVWAGGGGSTTYYYAALKAQVSSNSSGMGKVYAGTSNSAPSASSYKVDYSQSSSQNSTTENEKKNFYAFAQANDGYEFVGWSTSDNGSTSSSASPYTVQVACSSSTESSPTLTTIYANFKKKVLAAFNITFETSSAGSYTVDGAAPANKTGLTEATSITLASSDDKFLNWVVNGAEVTTNPYTASYTANTTISAVFLTADMVTSVTTLSDLTSALSNAQYKKVTIPSGTTIQIPKGTTVTVPSGKQLVMDGTLIVLGTLSNSGAISGNGTLYKISYKIDQGDVITVYTADSKECGAMTCACQDSKMPRYCKTTVTANTPTVSGTIGCTTTWGVLLNGATAYAISKQSPKAVKVNVDTSKDSNGKQSVVNKITSVVTNGNVDALDANANYVLFADCSMTGPLDSSKLRSTATVDCAGKRLSAGTNSHSSFGISVLNGSFSASASQWQNAHAAFFNMSSVSLSKIKGTGSTYYFYDCGTSASACSLSFAYYSSTRTSDYRTIYLYSGYYSYSFNTTDDSGKCNVYGGSFTKDPSSYIPSTYDGIIGAQYDGSKYYVVGAAQVAETLATIGDAEYSSLSDAVAAAKNGDVITLSAAIDLTGSTVTIPSGKSITLSLENHVITGGKIVNNGTLILTDSATGKGTTNADASGGILKSDIENYGTLDFVFGTYTGAISNKSGALTTHNGIFNGALAKEGGSVNLRGGHFTQDITSFVTSDAFNVFRKNNLYSVCELPDGTLRDTTINGVAGCAATPYSDADYTLIANWFTGTKSLRSGYSAETWAHLAELLCFYQVFNNNGLDATLKFDRDVAANTITLHARTTAAASRAIANDLSADSLYRGLSEVLNGGGYASKTYKALWQDNITTVALAVSDSNGANAGTVCTEMIELWEDLRASDYSSTGHKVTNTVLIVGQKRFTIGAGNNVAMIRPETGTATFYLTVTKALEAVEDGGTVMLANDSSDDVVFSKAGTYTINANGFEFSGSVTAAEGYEVTPFGDGVYVVSIDPAAKVDVEAVVSVVSDEWLDANEISTENKTPEEIQAAVQEVLSETDDNGNAKWENLVIGQDPTVTTAVTAANGGTETTATIEVSFEVPTNAETGEKIETGYTVKYAFDQVDTAGQVVVGGAGEAKEEPTLDFDKVEKNEPTYFKMRAVLEATDSSGVTAEVPVEKTIGVVKVASDAEVTIIPVPWQSLGDTDIKATELVHAASLSDDDELIVYGADGKPQTWVVKDGEWTAPVAEYTIGGGVFDPQQEEQQEAAELSRGQGAILKRKDTTKEIVLIGQAVTNATETVETPIAAATSSTEPSWNLVASPKMVEVAVDTVADANTSDEIIVPTAGTPKHYTYKNNAWGYTGKIGETEVTLPGGVKTTAVQFGRKTDDTAVPAGTGFWYLNKDSSNNDKKITW